MRAFSSRHPFLAWLHHPLQACPVPGLHFLRAPSEKAAGGRKGGGGGCGGQSRDEEEPTWQKKGCPTRGRPGPVAPGAPTPPGGGKPYRSVFAQLAECREGLLVRFAHLLDELPHLWCQRVALRALGLGRLLLLLVPVIPHSCGGQRPVVRGQVQPAVQPQPKLLPPELPLQDRGLHQAGAHAELCMTTCTHTQMHTRTSARADGRQHVVHPFTPCLTHIPNPATGPQEYSTSPLCPYSHAPAPAHT